MLDFLKRRKDFPGEGKFPSEPFPDTPFPKENSFQEPSFPRFEEPKMDRFEPKVSIAPSPVFSSQSSDNRISDSKIDVIIAKLDSLRSQMELINHRLDNLDAKLNKRW